MCFFEMEKSSSLHTVPHSHLLFQDVAEEGDEEEDDEEEDEDEESLDRSNFTKEEWKVNHRMSMQMASITSGNICHIFRLAGMFWMN